jgi:2-iminobutanoate/2-iminopropanoate deaminase
VSLLPCQNIRAAPTTPYICHFANTLIVSGNVIWSSSFLNSQKVLPMRIKLKYGLIISMLILPIAGISQTNKSIVKFDNPKNLYPPKGYSHVAIIDLGNCKMVMLSGQVPFDSLGNLVGNRDISKQTEQVFLNIKNAIADVGGSMENIVKLNYFLVEGEEVQPVRDIRDKFINTKTPPISTLVKVSRLFRDDILLEVEATFIIPKH